MVENLIRPGGNITGVQDGGYIPKLLEWQLTIAPDTRRIFVPHVPDDRSSVQSLAVLNEVATGQEIELVVAEARTPAEVTAALANIPEDVQAIFLPPVGMLADRRADFVEAAIKHKLPLISGINLQRAGVLLSYGKDNFEMGKQASRLADRILQGTPPAEVRVETAEFFLGINLQTAEAIGLDIPNEVLAQADDILAQAEDIVR